MIKAGVTKVQVALKYMLGFLPSIIQMSSENLFNPEFDTKKSW